MRGILALAALLLLLTGCVNLTMWRKSVNEQIDLWLENQYYAKALDAVETIPADHPEYAKVTARQAAIEEQARRFEAKTSAEVWELQGKGNWAEAFARLDDALQKMPESSRLAADRKKLLAEQQKQENLIARQQRRARAQWLLQQLELQGERVQVSALESGQKLELGKLQSEAEDLAGLLTDDALQEQKDGNTRQAQSDIELSIKLHPLPRARKALAELEKSSKRRAQQQSKQRKASIAKGKAAKLAALGQDYSEAMEEGRWQDAREAARALVQKEPDNADYRADLQRVESHIAKAVDDLYSEGIMLYSHGEYEQATSKWRAALVLDPDNGPSRESLMRSERVLERLKRLRAKQQQQPE